MHYALHRFTRHIICRTVHTGLTGILLIFCLATYVAAQSGGSGTTPRTAQPKPKTTEQPVTTPRGADSNPATDASSGRPDLNIKPPTSAPGGLAALRNQRGIGEVLQPSRSPLVSFRLLFTAGAVNDPKGKEGLAALTAAMLSQGGTSKMSYDEIVSAMYPMASSFGAQTDKELTVFSGTTHVDNLGKYYALISSMLLEPGFRQDDFTRLKQDAINYLKVSLRQNNDEELGKEQLYVNIYQNHPYGHQTTGTVSALENITLDDIKAFYRQHYSQANLTIGLAGQYPANFAATVKKDFQKLPVGASSLLTLPAPKLEDGTKIQIVQRTTRSTAISLGFPLDVNRANPDWAALALVASYFGQHRSSNSYLYQQLRERRGLNYGDYAYIEYFPRGMFQFQPDPNLARQQQIFQIWIRPVEPQNGLFALRAALYEYDKLVKNGMSAEDFESTREFLTKFSNVLTATQDSRLGYQLDSRFYGIQDYNSYLRAQLAKLKLEDVNRAIRAHLKTDAMRIVIITQDADGLRNAILGGAASPIIYNSEKPQEITDEDKIIQSFPVGVKAGDVTVISADKVFE